LPRLITKRVGGVSGNRYAQGEAENPTPRMMNYILCVVSEPILWVVSIGAGSVTVVSTVVPLASILVVSLLSLSFLSLVALLHAARDNIAQTERRAKIFFIDCFGDSLV